MKGFIFPSSEFCHVLQTAGGKLQQLQRRRSRPSVQRRCDPGTDSDPGEIQQMRERRPIGEHEVREQQRRGSLPRWATLGGLVRPRPDSAMNEECVCLRSVQNRGRDLTPAWRPSSFGKVSRRKSTFHTLTRKSPKVFSSSPNRFWKKEVAPPTAQEITSVLQLTSTIWNVVVLDTVRGNTEWVSPVRRQIAGQFAPQGVIGTDDSA